MIDPIGAHARINDHLISYIETAFGPFVGFLAGILLWFGGEVISTAAISVVVIDSVLAAVGLEVSGLLRAVLLVGLLAGLAVTNIRGVRTGARLVEVATAAKLVPLIALIVLAVFVSAGGLLLLYSAVGREPQVASHSTLVVRLAGNSAALPGR